MILVIQCACCDYISPLEIWERANTGHTMYSVRQEVEHKTRTLLMCPNCRNALSAYELRITKRRVKVTRGRR